MMRFIILIFTDAQQLSELFCYLVKLIDRWRDPDLEPPIHFIFLHATASPHTAGIFLICYPLSWVCTSVLISRLEQHHLKVSVLSPQTNPYYVKPRVNDHQFGIKHYAGEVINNTYTYTHRGKLVWPSSLSGWGSEVVVGWVAGLALPKSAAGCCGLLPESVQTVSPSSDLSLTWLEQLTCFRKIK